MYFCFLGNQNQCQKVTFMNYCQYSPPYIDIIWTVFVALVLYTGVAFYDTMKILSFSHHAHFFMVLTLNVITIFVAALFCIYA